MAVAEADDEKDEVLLYCCARCRTPLFRPEHIQPIGPATSTANAFFLTDALKWMEKESKEIVNKLHCPKCDARLGTLNWVGFQLPGSGWVCPAIMVHRKAVDPRRMGVSTPMVEPAAPDASAAAAGAAAD